ncbi:MAG: tetratricopeptide repeat protein [Culturomica sp.]|jgi:tetratricopeptide (TPR) repeat protein|nr:tetratricopeptide repeat protein [Culturomica sp.]
MAKKKIQEDKFEQLEDALTRSEQFIQKNQKILINSLVAVLVVVLAFFAYNKYVSEPNAREAETQIFTAQYYFEKDSLSLALNGDGNAPGFLEIIDNYGSTPAGNLAKYYAGLCYLYMGECDEAIGYLETFSSDDYFVNNMAKANVGDAYMQKGDYASAADKYKDAASSKKNDFSTPIFLMKSGLAYEKAGNFQSALKTYEEIKSNYPNSQEGRDIDKYIVRAQLSLNK